jgi:hydroxymethylglutaryl-CoA lyase
VELNSDTVVAMARVTWTDVGPRDGLQNISDVVPTEAKVELVRGLLGAGAPMVEAGAFVSPKWVPQMADSAEVIGALSDEERPRIRALIPNLQGLERAVDAGVGRVLFTIGATDDFNQRNVNKSVAESLDELDAIVAAGGTKVDVALSVAFGCPFSGPVAQEVVVNLCRELVARGVNEIGVADTIGVATPSAVHELCTVVKDVVPADKLSLHVHDTRGLAVANVLAAYEVGVARFDGSVGGVGGCPFAPRSTGNVCSEDALSGLVSVGAEIDADLAAYCDVASRLAEVLGRDLPGKLYRAGIWSGNAT